MSSMDWMYCRTAMETKRPNSADSKTTMPLAPHRKAMARRANTLCVPSKPTTPWRSSTCTSVVEKMWKTFVSPENTPQKEIRRNHLHTNPTNFLGFKIIKMWVFCGKIRCPLKNGWVGSHLLLHQKNSNKLRSSHILDTEKPPKQNKLDFCITFDVNHHLLSGRLCSELSGRAMMLLRPSNSCAVSMRWSNVIENDSASRWFWCLFLRWMEGGERGGWVEKFEVEDFFKGGIIYFWKEGGF